MVARDQRTAGPLDIPLVARWGTEHPSAPLVIALHGTGTSEHSMIEIAPWLPHGPVAYVSLRGPVEQGTGYAWCLDPEHPDPDDLAATCRWFLDWLDTEGDPDRPVLLIGFRDGVTFAGALMLSAPERFAGAMLLYGGLPLDAGLPMGRGALSGMPVFLAHGDADVRTPAPLLASTWDWLARYSGAPLMAEREPGGAQLAGAVVGHVGTWLGDRLDHIRAHGENPLPDGDEPPWPALPGGRLPVRSGPPPEATTTVPQRQLTQNAPAELQELLWKRLSALGGVSTAPATVGPPGTRSLLLDRATTTGPDAAYVLPAAGEFAHLHPDPDGSVHVALPDALAYDAIAKGWAVPHPLAGVRVAAGMVLVPGPRDAAEVDVVAGIGTAAHRHASG